MHSINQDAEARLFDVVANLKGSGQGYYALHYRLSRLLEKYRSHYQIRIAVNILIDVFKEQSGAVFVCKDKDLFLLYDGQDKTLLERAIFQLRYLFMDDPLAYTEDGSENDNFCSVFDLGLQWPDLYQACRLKIGRASLYVAPPSNDNQDHQDHQDHQDDKVAVSQKPASLTFEHLGFILEKLREIDIAPALRQQPVCVYRQPSGKDTMKSVFREIYVNIHHLTGLLGAEVDLLSNHLLFKYFLRNLDQKVLAFLCEQSLQASLPISLNLSVQTLFSEEFSAFDERFKTREKAKIIIELHVSDIFDDIHQFIVARDVIRKRGYRFCLDGLDRTSFLKLDIKNLGFDLVKLRWHAQTDSENFHKAGSFHKGCDDDAMMKAVQDYGANRVILCRCGEQEAISYGHALGLSLFQGWFVDRIVTPHLAVVN